MRSYPGPTPASAKKCFMPPAGATIIQTAVAEDRIVITIRLNGAIEIRACDVKTLNPAARPSFTTVP